MEQVPIPPDRITDPFEKLLPGYELNRDPERAPMRWDAGRNAGFTGGCLHSIAQSKRHTEL